jgi:hypothetical protein
VSQRDSGYERKTGDLYETPAWVTAALVPHIPERIKSVWEPACGSGKMAGVLEANGFKVHCTDIESGDDFLSCPTVRSDAIITNPPYKLATEFIVRSMASAGFVAMLLRTDFDHAASRQHLFGHYIFAKKVVLTKRIKWFEDSKGSPSFNHAWFIWDGHHQGAPTLAYGPC